MESIEAILQIIKPKGKKVLFIGGGTGGHIYPLVPLVQASQEQCHDWQWVTGKSELEKNIFAHEYPHWNSKRLSLKTGKIRRYWSWQNFTDLWLVMTSVIRAGFILYQTRPDILFFKGGHVGFPFIVWLKIFGKGSKKVFLHESDSVDGVLTKLYGSKADFVFRNFGEPSHPLYYFEENIRPFAGAVGKVARNVDLPTSSPCKGEKKKNILVFGGSQGAEVLNDFFIEHADRIKDYQIKLVTGLNYDVRTNNISKNLTVIPYLSQKEMWQAMAACDTAICRAGASIWQLKHLNKPMILIPLPTSAQSHQQKNAEYFMEKGWAELIKQDDLSLETVKKFL